MAIYTSINLAIKDLKKRHIGGIYLPNMRWFQGEESEGPSRESFTFQLAGLADVYVNDAFGSWQPHASTYDITKHLPSFAGFLMQQEIRHLNALLEPERPFLALIAGAKFDAKIGPLYEIYEKADYLLLGGIIYNTFLCAKYNVNIRGIPRRDIEAVRDLVKMIKKIGV